MAFDGFFSGKTILNSIPLFSAQACAKRNLPRGVAATDFNPVLFFSFTVQL